MRSNLTSRRVKFAQMMRESNITHHHTTRCPLTSHQHECCFVALGHTLNLVTIHHMSLACTYSALWVNCVSHFAMFGLTTHKEGVVLVTVCNPHLKDYMRKSACEPMMSPCHRPCHSFFFSPSRHLWVGFPWPRFPLREPVPCRQPTTNMQWQFKSVQFTGSGCDSGHWAPGGKDAYATRQAELWQKVRGARQCGVSGSFMSVSPGTWPSFSSSVLFRETGTGAAPGPFASQREKRAWQLSSVIHRHWLQQRICLEYCYASRKGTVPLWSRHRTEAGVFRSSVLFELEAVCCPIWASAYQTVYCTSTGFRAAILQLAHEKDGLMDIWRKCSSLSQVVPASSALLIASLSFLFR